LLKCENQKNGLTLVLSFFKEKYSNKATRKWGGDDDNNNNIIWREFNTRIADLESAKLNLRRCRVSKRVINYMTSK